MSGSNNPRKRAAPGAAPIVPIPQQMQQPYSNGNAPGDMMRWNGVGDMSGFDGTQQAGNNYGLIPSQPQYPQAVPTPSSSLTRRPINRALVPTNPRSNFDAGSNPWTGFDDVALIQQNPGDNVPVQDSVEVLEEMASKAKREAQAKRKQIPPFVQKLSSFLEEKRNEDLIRWSESGDSFIVLDEDEFAKTLIPELFKHNNYASFVRQLNMYGFHKRVGLSDNSMRASERKNKSPSEYSNPYFRRGHPNLLWLINKPKSGSKAKKGKGNAEGDVDSEEEIGNEEVIGQGLGTSNVPTGRSLPPAESQPIQKKEMSLVKEELSKVREQQKLILGAINRLNRNNQDLYNQAVMFQSQHDRHQNSINAILNFLANVFRKTLEDQGNSQSVSDIISSMITSQGQQSGHHSSVVDLGDYIQSQIDPTGQFSTPHKKARGLLPPIPSQTQTPNQNNRSQSSRSRSTGSSSFLQHNPEMGHVTELLDGSPTDTSSPTLRQELESNPHERMMKIINDHNATNSHGMDLPEAAELVNNAPNTLNHDQRNKLVDFMASQSNTSAPSNKATPSTSAPSMGMGSMPPSSVSPAPPPPNDPKPQMPSLSPIMQSPMVPPSLHQIGSHQVDLDELQRLQQDQDAKIHEIGSILGPLSPSGHIPGLDEGADQYFDQPHVDLEPYLDSSVFFNDNHFGDGNDFNFNLDADANVNNNHNQNQNQNQQNSLAPGQVFNNNTPSPAGTEEIQREDFGGYDGSPDRGKKRQRVG